MKKLVIVASILLGGCLFAPETKTKVIDCGTIGVPWPGDSTVYVISGDSCKGDSHNE